jgi:hypothetical protein
MLEKYCIVTSFLTYSISASNVQFRAGSSNIGSGGTLHPAAQLIANPRYDAYAIGFDVAVARISDNTISKLIF